jgi:hypothetical protein
VTGCWQPSGARRALEEVTGGFLQSGDETVDISMRIEKVSIVGGGCSQATESLPASRHAPKMIADCLFTQTEANIQPNLVANDRWLLDRTRFSFRTAILRRVRNGNR